MFFLPAALKVRFYFKQETKHFKPCSGSRAVSGASGHSVTWDMTHWPNDSFHKALQAKNIIISPFLLPCLPRCVSVVQSLGMKASRLRSGALQSSPRVQRRQTTEQGWNSTLQRQKRDQGECLHKRSRSYFSLLQHYPLLTEQQTMRRSSRQTLICARSQ